MDTYEKLAKAHLDKMFKEEVFTYPPEDVTELAALLRRVAEQQKEQDAKIDDVPPFLKGEEHANGE